MAAGGRAGTTGIWKAASRALLHGGEMMEHQMDRGTELGPTCKRESGRGWVTGPAGLAPLEPVKKKKPRLSQVPMLPSR